MNLYLFYLPTVISSNRFLLLDKLTNLVKILVQGPLGLDLHIYQKPDHPRSMVVYISRIVQIFTHTPKLAPCGTLKFYPLLYLCRLLTLILQPAFGKTLKTECCKIFLLNLFRSYQSMNIIWCEGLQIVKIGKFHWKISVLRLFLAVFW